MAMDRKGFVIAALSFVIWGLVPLYWHLLKAVPSLQIMAHRVLWSAVLVVGWLVLKDGLGWWRKVSGQPRALATLAASSVLIAFNWSLYI